MFVWEQEGVWESEHFFQRIESVVFYSYVTLIVTLVFNIRNVIYSHNVSDIGIFPSFFASKSSANSSNFSNI